MYGHLVKQMKSSSASRSKALDGDVEDGDRKLGGQGDNEDRNEGQQAPLQDLFRFVLGVQVEPFGVVAVDCLHSRKRTVGIADTPMEWTAEWCCWHLQQLL